MRGLSPIAVWRRLLASPRPSADLERFLGWLAATPYTWSLGSDGKLRADDHGEPLCAVTGVARHRAHQIFSVGDWVRAGECLGLSYRSAGLIVDAADARLSNAFLKALRARLLLAARVGTAPVSAPIADPRGSRARRPRLATVASRTAHRAARQSRSRHASNVGPHRDAVTGVSARTAS